MYTHTLLIFMLVGPPDTCPEVLLPVCDAADRPLEAAELAAPIARDASVAPQERRFAAALAAGAWIRHGTPATRCKAKELLGEYFADPALPRSPALERHRRDVEADRCETAPDASAATTTASPPPPPPPRAPAPEARPPAATHDRSAKVRLVAGGTLLGTGVGLAAATLGALAVMGHQLSTAREITARVTAEDRDMTREEVLQFRLAYGVADVARWVSLGVGLASAATLAAAIPLFVSAKRRLRAGPYVRGAAAGVMFSGSF
ncbi:hypothetical protein [Nannocystis bainbridge]|uniref:Uncharacterized protein n=1 Tax=Nannocystis bainbridge TaxID=2995303 RepID=A0ABT5DY07_9BACT|nr:hypothetical protein [Nannocystis bainbridge]MDC0717317.1 hypothetical protein [Nannocystis bainbridge]